MEEPIDSFQSPKQDKMISLIAWLIIASLLFYVVVFTFESFLKKTPSVLVSAENDQFLEDIIEEETPFIVEVDKKDQFIQKTNQEATQVANQEVTVLAEVGEEKGGNNSIDSFFSELVSDISDKENQEVGFQNPLINKDTKLEVKEVASNKATTIPLDNLTSSNQELTHYLEFSKKFFTMRDAFTYLVGLNFGQFEPEFELLSENNSYRVLFSVTMDSSDINAYKKYLDRVNPGLSIRLLDKNDILSIEKQYNRKLSTGLPLTVKDSKDAVNSFRSNSLKRPVTIQIGSFLNGQNAAALRDKMISRGYLADVEEIYIGNKTQYRVLLGNYASKSEASLVAVEVSDKYELPVYVREVKP